jgi:hypothetical protein
MKYRRRQTGRTLHLKHQRDGKGYFTDGNSSVICPMAHVTDDANLPLPEWPVMPLSYYVWLIECVRRVA